MDFREFLDTIDTVAHIFVEASTKMKQARREQILNHWSKLPPNLPVQLEPITVAHKGTRYRSDGLRITGSPTFINAILSRVKDILAYENPETEIDVEFQQISSPKGFDPRTDYDTPKYVAYVHVTQRNLQKMKKKQKKAAAKWSGK